MANILVYNPLNGDPLEYRRSQHTPDYLGRPDVLINPDFVGPVNDYIVKSGILVLATTEELAARKARMDSILWESRRKDNYPAIENQLDAILKQLEKMSISGETVLEPDAQKIVDEWRTVKTTYPKPVESK